MRALRPQGGHRPGVLPGERHIDDLSRRYEVPFSLAGVHIIPERDIVPRAAPPLGGEGDIVPAGEGIAPYLLQISTIRARLIVPVGCLSPFLVLKLRSSGLNRNRIVLSIFGSHIMRVHSKRIEVFPKNIRFFFPTQLVACALSRGGFQPPSATPLTRVSGAIRPAPSRHKPRRRQAAIGRFGDKSRQPSTTLRSVPWGMSRRCFPVYQPLFAISSPKGDIVPRVYEWLPHKTSRRRDGISTFSFLQSFFFVTL